jgi:hypothetical protein
MHVLRANLSGPAAQLSDYAVGRTHLTTEIIDSNGVMRVPLFHGTSTLFSHSISEFGLGGRDPVQELQALEFFREVVNLCRKHLQQDDDWIAHEYVLGAMERQTIARLNFRHGSTYLTPSRYTARGYAGSNEYGSELISTAFEWWTKLNRVDALRPALRELSSHQLLQLYPQSRQPLLVRADAGPLTSLRTEHGGDPHETIAMMGDTIEADDPLREASWQQLNFELVSPVPAAQLTFSVLAPRDLDDPYSPLVEKPWRM